MRRWFLPLLALLLVLSVLGGFIALDASRAYRERPLLPDVVISDTQIS